MSTSAVSAINKNLRFNNVIDIEEDDDIIKLMDITSGSYYKIILIEKNINEETNTTSETHTIFEVINNDVFTISAEKDVYIYIDSATIYFKGLEGKIDVVIDFYEEFNLNVEIVTDATKITNITQPNKTTAYDFKTSNGALYIKNFAGDSVFVNELTTSTSQVDVITANKITLGAWQFESKDGSLIVKLNK